MSHLKISYIPGGYDRKIYDRLHGGQTGTERRATSQRREGPHQVAVLHQPEEW